MKVHHGIENIVAHNPVVTIGSFDGVHLGHACVIRHLRRKAADIGGEAVVISFEPHPREVLYPMEKKPGLLTTPEEKARLLEHYGVDHLVILPFTLDFAQQSYTDFVRDVLVEKLRMRGLVVGYDHHFGKNRKGDFDSLLVLSRHYGFFLERENVFEEDEMNVSSTKIRDALARGDIALANRFLGYSYSFTGEVVPGQHLGNRIGFPTANIALPDERKLLPAGGVYAVKVSVDGEVYGGMLNIGVRPTISQEGMVTREVNIFDFNRQIYGKSITVHLAAWIRGERKFADVAELKVQLQQDKKKVLELLSSTK